MSGRRAPDREAAGRSHSHRKVVLGSNIGHSAYAREKISIAGFSANWSGYRRASHSRLPRAPASRPHRRRGLANSGPVWLLGRMDTFRVLAQRRERAAVHLDAPGGHDPFVGLPGLRCEHDYRGVVGLQLDDRVAARAPVGVLADPLQWLAAPSVWARKPRIRGSVACHPTVHLVPNAPNRPLFPQASRQAPPDGELGTLRAQRQPAAARRTVPDPQVVGVVAIVIVVMDGRAGERGVKRGDLGHAGESLRPDSASGVYPRLWPEMCGVTAAEPQRTSGRPNRKV